MRTSTRLGRLQRSGLGSVQLLNATLRMLPILAKFVLTLYMGKFFSLNDIGMYGLVFGTVTVLTVLLGQRFDYIVTRDIIGIEPREALHKIRDQAILFGLNYLALAAVIFALIATHATNLSASTLLYILGLTIMEGFGNMIYANMNSLNYQLIANLLFFLRAGAWVAPVLILGALRPEFRSDQMVFLAWLSGAALSVGVTIALCFRRFPCMDVLRLPVQWGWIGRGLRRTSLIWLGACGLVGGSFVDRFVVADYLDIEAVGVLTFYASFTNAVYNLLQSGVLSFAYPQLVGFYKRGEMERFRQLSRKVAWQVGAGATFIVIAIGIFVPLFGYFFHRPVFIANRMVLWLMLLGTWLRANAEPNYYILFARHQDRPIWLGNLLYLIPAFGGNILFVRMFGFIGIGYASALAGFLLFAWRYYYRSRPFPANVPLAAEGTHT
jgi:O-antigen/teichoic acid export membrane protein